MTTLEAFNILKKTHHQSLTLNLAGKIVDHDFYMKAARYVKDNKLEGFVNFLGSWMKTI